MDSICGIVASGGVTMGGSPHAMILIAAIALVLIGAALTVVGFTGHKPMFGAIGATTLVLAFVVIIAVIPEAESRAASRNLASIQSHYDVSSIRSADGTPLDAYNVVGGPALRVDGDQSIDVVFTAAGNRSEKGVLRTRNGVATLYVGSAGSRIEYGTAACASTDRGHADTGKGGNTDTDKGTAGHRR